MLLEVYLQRIERLDGHRAYRVVQFDRAACGGPRPPSNASTPVSGCRHKMPIAIKDDVDIAGEVTTAAPGAVGRDTSDAELVLRLRAAGAVIISGLTCLS